MHLPTRDMLITDDKQTDARWANVALAASNLAGGPLLLVAHTAYVAWLVRLMLLASFLMHVSERKHALPGVWPFNQYSSAFLWLDRVMALVCGVFGAHRAYLLWYAAGASPYLLATLAGFSLGLAALYVSEHHCRTHAQFVAWHGAWHVLAYWSLYRVLDA